MTPLVPLVSAATLVTPSLHVTPSPVSRGAIVRVVGNAGLCPAGDRIAIGSRAFAGSAFAGVGGVSTAVGAGGAFAVSARVSSTVAAGTYTVTARCGGGNLGVASRLVVVSGPTESVRLISLAGSGLGGTITYLGSGRDTVVRLRLSGSVANARIRVLLQTGACAGRGVTVALVAEGDADSRGGFVLQRRLRAHGRSLPVDAVADGTHAFVVVSAHRTIACAAIPGIG